jgi:hypothetical protein
MLMLEMPVPSQGHYGFHSFPLVDWFCLFIYLWVLTFPLEDCSEFGNFVITLILIWILNNTLTHLYIWLADDNCVETFENTLDNNRRLLKQQDCPCDAEHMWSCPETDHDIKASDGSYADWMEQMNKPNSDLVR